MARKILIGGFIITVVLLCFICLRTLLTDERPPLVRRTAAERKLDVLIDLVIKAQGEVEVLNGRPLTVTEKKDYDRLQEAVAKATVQLSVGQKYNGLQEAVAKLTNTLATYSPIEYYPLNPIPGGHAVAAAVPDQACEDHDPRCTELAKTDCHTRADWMEPMCKRACNLCHIRDTRFDAASQAFAVGKRFDTMVSKLVSTTPDWKVANARKDEVHNDIAAYLAGVCDEDSELYEGNQTWAKGLCEGGDVNSGLMGHTGQMVRQTMSYMALAAVKQPRTVCEVGINAGHSAATLLSALNPGATYIGFEFDAIGKGVNFRLAERMRSHFEQTHKTRIVIGKSQETVPAFFAPRRIKRMGVNCQLVTVDGSHAFHDVLMDLRNFKKAVDPEKHLVLVDDTRCTSWYCEPPTRAWTAAIEEGLIRELACWSSSYNASDPERWDPSSRLPRFHPDYRGWCVGEYIFETSRVGNVSATEALETLQRNFLTEDTHPILYTIYAVFGGFGKGFFYVVGIGIMVAVLCFVMNPQNHQ